MGLKDALLALLNLRRDQRERERQMLAQVEKDWRDSFTGTIDEFKARDAA